MLPINENARMESLYALGLLDSPAEDRFDRIARMAQAMFSVDASAISLVDRQRCWFKSHIGLAQTSLPRHAFPCQQTVLTDDVVVVNDGDTETESQYPIIGPNADYRFYAGVAIHSPAGYRIGTLCVFHGERRLWEPRDDELLREFAAMVDREIAISSQVTVDPQTGIANRRGFTIVANHMLALCRRAKTPAELVLLDIDGFRLLNETLGHPTGDQLLEYFAAQISRSFRHADAAGRTGSNEFAILMAGSHRSAKVAIQRLHENTKDDPPPIANGFSWRSGVVQFDSDRHTTIERFLADADNVMFKETARHRERQLNESI